MHIIYLPGWLRKLSILLRIAVLLALMGLAVPRLAALIAQLLNG